MLTLLYSQTKLGNACDAVVAAENGDDALIFAAAGWQTTKQSSWYQLPATSVHLY